MVAHEEQGTAIERRVSRLSWFLDDSIRLPGGYRIGFDSLVGLIPGLGDGVGLLLSSYIIGAAARSGVSRWVLARMMANVVIDAAIGTIPVIGDLFDAAWKANRRNRDLFLRHRVEPDETRKASAAVVIGVLLILLGVSAAIVYGVLRLLVWIFAQLG